MKRYLTLFLFVLVFSGSGFAALTGTKTIGVNYPSLAAAIADLNTQGAGPGGVTFNIPAGYTETFLLPTDGMITTTTGSSANPIIFQKSGTGANPVITAAVGTGTMDGIIIIAGTDYVTFNGIDVKDAVSNVTPTTQAEWGYAILKASATDGSQNITIRNCTVTLAITNTATAGIYSNNHIFGNNTALTVTNVSGANSNLKIYSNSVQAYTGISLTGFNDVTSPYTYLDQNNEIGKDGANAITSVAGSTAAGYGIYANAQNNLKVANNIITSAMGGSGQPSAIYVTNARNASYDIYSNSVNMQFTGTGSTAMYGIFSDAGASSTTSISNIYNNTISGCSFPTATTGNFYLMYMTSAGNTLNVYGNNIINNTVGASTVTATSRVHYIYINRPTSITGPVNIYNNTISGNNKIQSVLGSGLTYGFAFIGNSSQLNFYNNTFTNMSIASNGGLYALYVSGNGPKDIHDNQITNITKAEGTSYGIYISSSANNSGDAYVYRNKIQNIEGLSASVGIYGIYASNSGTAGYFYNNTVADLRTPSASAIVGVTGLHSNSGSGNYFYNNTVYLNASSSGTNYGANAIYLSASVPTDVRNNILINTSTANGTGKVAVIRNSAVSLTNYNQLSNYNNLYTTAANYIYWDGTSGDQTLSAYKSRAFPREGQSVSELTPLMNTTPGAMDLHVKTTNPSQCEAGGCPITTPVAITTDFENDARFPNAGYPINALSNPNAPDIGADEFGGLSNDIVGPALWFTPLGQTNLTTPRTLNVTITDGSGVPTSGTGLPVLYWKINTGSYQSVQATYVSPGNYSFTFGGGVTIGDQVFYYIVAQDIASTPNVSCVPSPGASGFTYNPPACSTPTSSPYGYTILESISGIKHVGVGKDFNTLGEAAAAVNTKWIAGPLTFVLDDPSYPLESYPVTLNPNPGSSAVNTLTIKPNAGNSPTIQANVTTGLLNLNGIDYVTIDGSNNGTGSRNMTFRNQATNSGSYAIIINNYNGDPSTNITIKNSVMICTPVHSSIVDISVIRTGTSGGNNNITIDNNNIKAGFYGIRAAGASTKINANWVISNNLIGAVPDSLAITDIGVFITNTDNTLVYNNEIMGPVSGSLNTGQCGVNISTQATNTKVSGNKIHDFIRTVDDGWGVSGIWYSAEANTVTEISNNSIYNIHSPGINPGVGQNITYGIFIRNGGNVKILHNSVNLTGAYLSNTYDASSSCLGIYYLCTGNVEVKNNIFRNGMTTLSGTPNTTGKAFGVMVSILPTMFSMDYNDYYIDGTNGSIGQYYLGSNGTYIEYTTLNDWRTYTGQESNSRTTNPQFTSSTNLLPTSTAMPHAGIYQTLVPTDITGINRTNPPDLGAYEFTVNPVINTTAATSVLNNSAIMNGTANAIGTNFDLFFDYGTTTAYGTSVAATPATTTGSVLIPMSYNLTGLLPLTTYHFRARGVTSGGLIVYGNDFTFTTLANPPTVVTTAATGVTSSAATLNGTVNANSATTAATFEYGLTTAYGNVIAATPGSVTGGIVTPVLANLTGLLPNTTYHYRAVGVNSTGTTYGSDLTFTTAAILSNVITNIASGVSTTGAQLNGTVTANNATTAVTFQWGTTTAYGNTITATPANANGMSATSVMATLGSLAINTTYHYRCVGVNVAGTSYGLDQVFTTNCVSPVITVAGPATACAASTGNVYTTQSGNSNYTWTVSAGGTITSGAGTNAITVTWNTPGAQNVSVNYSNTYGCTAFAPFVYNVTVNALPTPVITGSATGCQSTSNNTYSTQAGMTNYTWTVTGGTITSGSGTNTIQVSWNTPGAQTVSVNYNNASGCSATAPTVQNVTVNPAPVPTINGTTSVCANSGYIAYTTESGMSNYSWTVSAGGTITAGQGTNQVQVSWTGTGAQTVSVNYANAGGCTAPNATVLNVTVNPAPGAAGNITGTSTVCGGATGIAYSTTPVANAVTYVWTLPAGATIASGAGTNSITVDFAANASSGDITVYGNNLCGNGTVSPAFPVTVNAVPGAAGTISGPASVCEGTTGVTYYVSPIANATSYNWMVPAGATIVSGASTSSITVDYTVPGTGNVTVNGINTCGSGTSSSLAVTIHEIPAAPVITLNGTLLSSSAADGNQWYKDGNVIPGATGQTLDASLYGSGWYWTMVSLNGCSSDTSMHVQVIITGVEEKAGNSCTIYPVPNDGKFTVVPGRDLKAFTLRVVSATGQMILNEKHEGIRQGDSFIVDLRPVAAGIYTVMMSNEDTSLIKKIVVNK